MASNTRINAARESIGFVVVVAGILITLNVLGAFFSLGRLDFTSAKLFSLSEGSERLVSKLDDKMEIVAYFSKNLPPPFNSTERYTRDVLEEYEVASNGNIRVRFVNPDTDELREQADQDGVRKVSHQKIENDSVSVVEGYRGLVIKHLGDNKAIPVIQDTSGLEYTITQSIKEITGEKRPVGILSGHEGPTLAKGLTGLQSALPTYELKEVSAEQAIDPSLSALLVISPETALSGTELKNITDFVVGGKSLGVFGGVSKLSLEGEPKVDKVDTGLNDLLGKWGVKFRDGVVFDWQCSRAPMRGPLGLQVAVPYPPVPIVSFKKEESEHPVLFRLPSALFPFTSSLTVSKAPSGAKVETLARSSENSWRVKEDSLALSPRHPREWAQSGRSGPFPLLVSVEGKLSTKGDSGAMSSADGDDSPAKTSDRAVRVLVAGTSAFLRDEFLPPAGPDGKRDLSGALALGLNAIDWLAAESDLIEIRAKNVEDPPLEVPVAVTEATEDATTAAEAQDREGMEKALEKRKTALASWESRKAMYRWGNTLGIPFLIGLFGVVRWRRRVAKKKNLSL